MLKIIQRYFILPAVILLASGAIAACSTAGMHHEDEEMPAHSPASHDDHDHEDHHGGDRIPNNGAVIRIASPEEGALFGEFEDVIIEVEIDNFVLGEEGNHWHVYVDGVSRAHVMSQAHDYALRGLEPGDYLLEVFLADGNHRDLEEGDAVTITIHEE